MTLINLFQPVPDGRDIVPLPRQRTVSFLGGPRGSAMVHGRGISPVFDRAVSSAVERLSYTQLVGGSIPSLPMSLIFNGLARRDRRNGNKNGNTFAKHRRTLCFKFRNRDSILSKTPRGSKPNPLPRSPQGPGAKDISRHGGRCQAASHETDCFPRSCRPLLRSRRLFDLGHPGSHGGEALSEGSR